MHPAQLMGPSCKSRQKCNAQSMLACSPDPAGCLALAWVHYTAELWPQPGDRRVWCCMGVNKSNALLPRPAPQNAVGHSALVPRTCECHGMRAQCTQPMSGAAGRLGELLAIGVGLQCSPAGGEGGDRLAILSVLTLCNPRLVARRPSGKACHGGLACAWI
jgi:hypothetical protein